MRKNNHFLGVLTFFKQALIRNTADEKKPERLLNYKEREKYEKNT